MRTTKHRADGPISTGPLPCARWRSLVTLATLAALAGGSTPARADTTTIGPSRDTSIYEESGTLANGAGAHFFAGQTDGGDVRRALLFFDVGGALPAGSIITSVSLHLYCDRTRTQDETIDVHRLTNDWGEGLSVASGEEGQGALATEGSATWTRRFFDTVSWDSVGADFVSTPSASLTVRNANAYYIWQGSGLVADVQAWLDDPTTNRGWLVRGDEVAIKATKRFASRENPDLTILPHLTIEFTPPAATTGACCSASGACTLVLAPGATSCSTGTYQGDGTSCAPNPCPLPSGACCFADPSATCVETTETSCDSQGGAFRGALSICTPDRCPVVLAPYVDPLPIPHAAEPTSGTQGGSATYLMAIRETSQQLHRDLPPTRVWGFDDGTGTTYPGPTLETRSEIPIAVGWWNDLRDEGGALRTDHFLPVDLCVDGAADDARTVMHLHGGHVPSSVDGYPESTFVPGQQVSYTYPNHQTAATLWYHDHAFGLTRLNVTMGLAGLYVVRDDVEESLGLPSGTYDVPLVIQDRSFHPDGSFAYPEMFMDHFFGDTVLVNGKVWPYLEVARGKYRFRVLNGSNSRSYHLTFSNGMSFHVIGTDDGLIDAPIATNELTLSPGERAEIVVDFAPFAALTEIEIVNDASAPFPGIPGDGSIREIMLVRVGAASGHTAALPSTLRPSIPLDPGDAVVERTFSLDKQSDPCGGSMWTINALRWEDITERAVLGSSEIWRFVNRSGASHPMHMHLVSFQVLDRYAFIDIGGIPTPTGGALPILPTERGPKDTVLVGPGEIVRVIARFEDYVGRYPYHCHVLEHEDHEMMRQFETTTQCGDGIFSPPIESCEDGNLVAGDGCEPNCQRTCDVSGACDDTDACTSDACVDSTGCTHAVVDCDDGEDCTTDTCATASGCAHASVPDDTPCSIGACRSGVCTSFPPDAGVDAGIDAGLDAGFDAGFDAGIDAGLDAGFDAGLDAGLDAGFDAGFDAGIDAGFDSGVEDDAALDAAPDADAAGDSGLDAAVVDAGRPSSPDGGCTCQVARRSGAPSISHLAWLAVLAASCLRRNRRRSSPDRRT